MGGLPRVHQRTPGGVGTPPSLRAYLLDNLSGERHLHPHPVVIMVVHSFVDAAETAASLVRDFPVVVPAAVAAVGFVGYLYPLI